MHGDAVPAFEMQIVPDLPFPAHDGASLSGTLYRPDSPKPCPVLVAIHGGGWKRGSPDRYRNWGVWLAQRGIALFAIKYRLADRAQHRFPIPALDVFAALRFVSASAAELKVAPERIGLMGDSAGAHLACLAALAGDPSALASGAPAADRTLFNIRAVVAVYGVYDLLQQWEHDQIARPTDHVTEALMGFSPLEDKLAYYRASPLAYTTVRAPRSSFLICWGTGDDVVDWEPQSGRLVRELKQTGQYVRTVAVQGAPHFWIDESIEANGSFTGFLAPKLFKFLQEQL